MCNRYVSVREQDRELGESERGVHTQPAPLAVAGSDKI